MPSCCRETRSARSRSKARAQAGSRPRRPWSRTWSPSSGRPAPGSSRTTRSGGRCPGCPPATSPRRTTSASRSRTAPGVLARIAQALAAEGGLGGAARAAARQRPRDPARDHARGLRGPYRGGARAPSARFPSPEAMRSRSPSSPSAESRSSVGPSHSLLRREWLRGHGMTIPLIDRYRERLPVSETTPVISLGEGSTPLIRAPRLSERYGSTCG